MALPLRVTGRTIGSITLSFPGAFEADPVVLDFLDIMADTCAQAFERIDASVVARRQTARLAFLAEASDRAREQPRPRGDHQPGGPTGRAHLRRLVRDRRRA